MKTKLPALTLAGILGTLGAGLAGAGAADEPPAQEKAEMPLEEKLAGYWAPDWNETSVKWKPMFKELAKLGAAHFSKAELAEKEKQVEQEAKEYCSISTIEFTKNKFRQHRGTGQVEEQDYIVKKIDAKAGTIEVELISRTGGKPERDNIVLKGDRLTVTMLGEGESAPWILDRIDKAAFEKRQKEAAGSQKVKDTGRKPQDPDKPPGK